MNKIIIKIQKQKPAHKSMNKPNKRIKFAKRLGISGLLESQLFCCTLYNHQSTDWLLFEIIHIQTLIDVAFFPVVVVGLVALSPSDSLRSDDPFIINSRTCNGKE